jgi:CRISPR-associated protein Csm3
VEAVEYSTIRLYGRIILEGEIEARTGLHIGGSPGALGIGGVDLPVIRNAVDQRPYIPGSSLKGKMRSLWEKATGAKQNRGIGKGVTIHACEKKEEYSQCPVCQIFGTLGQNEAAFPTRIIVRDVPLAEDSLKDVRTDMPFTEVKWEAAIDRVTSAATPRQIERVPAGAVFEPMQIVFNIYEAGDFERFLHVLTTLQMVEDDYLGGQGTRGSGRVAFRNLSLTCKSTENYQAGTTEEIDSLEGGRAKLEWIRSQIPIPANGGK